MRLVRQFILGSALLVWSAGASAQDAPAPTLPPADGPTGAVAPAPTTPPAASVSDRIAFLLSGYEYFPTRVDLDAVAAPDEVTAVLRGFATDLDARPTLRLRAVDALGYYDDDATVALLTDLVQNAPPADLPRKKARTAGLIRHHAISALVSARRGAAVPVIEPLLVADDLQIVLTAVSALGKHGGAQGRAALANLLDSSPDDIVRREAMRWVGSAAK